MNIYEVSGRTEAERVSGTAILVDIFRATTTVSVALKKGVQYVVPFLRIRDAKRFSRENGNVVTIGERFGIKIPGFDFNNSPSDLMAADLEGKIAALTTTNGTRALNNLKTEKILASSFLNHSATLNVIKDEEEVWIVRSDRPDGPAEEDRIYAEFLRESLKGNGPSIEEYAERIRMCKGARSLSLLGYSRDVDFSLKLDLVDFPIYYRENKFIRG